VKGRGDVKMHAPLSAALATFDGDRSETTLAVTARPLTHDLEAATTAAAQVAHLRVDAIEATHDDGACRRRAGTPTFFAFAAAVARDDDDDRDEHGDTEQERDHDDTNGARGTVPR